MVHQLLPTSHLKFSQKKCYWVELRFRATEFDQAFVVSHLQRHSLLQLRRSKTVLGEIWTRRGDVLELEVLIAFVCGKNADDTGAANDVAFSIHAILLTAITLFQVVIYERGSQKVSRISIGIVAAVWLGAAVCFFVALPTHSWLWLISIFNSIQVFMTAIKYIPQAIFNFTRKSTVGFSIGNILLDFSGGVANYAQMGVQSIDQGSWVNFYGNMGKTLLSLISIFFDLLFMGQHFVLYPAKGATISSKISKEESAEPLVKSSDDPVSENL
ncbi:cystinosin homolog isoform X2 [Rosa chinensis]|uniref:cystinosin homolog isoform X2 n=1 Tax=Rosa chinensis TaxID=74649 RepID=UPI000D087347|nr:cystinosin homolog isoform X2 [Rosa chinensis]